MKKTITFIIGLCISVILFAQPKEVTLVVSGEGANKTEATNNALRSAIEQAFGTFVSANTTILNDEVVKDEIATISSGNIESYEELGSVSSETGVMVSLKAIVSVQKLVNYVRNYGSECEFAGDSFAANIKMRELNRINESSALMHLASNLISLSPTLFDISISSDNNPKLEKSPNATGYIFNNVITLSARDEFIKASSLLQNTISSLSLSDKELQEYKNNAYPYSKFQINSVNYYLRSDEQILLEFRNQMERAVLQSMFGFHVIAKSSKQQDYVIDYDSIGPVDKTFVTINGRLMNVTSSSTNYIGTLKDYKSNYNNEYLNWLLIRYTSGYLGRVDSYDNLPRLFWPSFGTKINRNSIILSFTIPLFINESDLNDLKGFTIKFVEINQDNLKDHYMNYEKLDYSNVVINNISMTKLEEAANKMLNALKQCNSLFDEINLNSQSWPDQIKKEKEDYLNQELTGVNEGISLIYGIYKECCNPSLDSEISIPDIFGRVIIMLSSKYPGCELILLLEESKQLINNLF